MSDMILIEDEHGLTVVIRLQSINRIEEQKDGTYDVYWPTGWRNYSAKVGNAIIAAIRERNLRLEVTA